MVIGNYNLKRESDCWVLSEIKTVQAGDNKGDTYEGNSLYYSRLYQALLYLMDVGIGSNTIELQDAVSVINAQAKEIKKLADKIESKYKKQLLP